MNFISITMNVDKILTMDTDKHEGGCVCVIVTVRNVYSLVRIMLLVAVLFAATVSYSSAQTCPAGCSCVRDRVICSGLQLTEIPVFPDSIKATTTTVDLSSNSITSVRSTDFQGFTSLETLRLDFNDINSIEPGSFSTNVVLTDLELPNNNLRELPDNLFQNTQLLTLNLDDNDIARLSSSTFTGFQSGGQISLSGNLLQTIGEDTFDAVGSIRQLSLLRNPFNCDCRMRWFPEFRNINLTITSNLGTCMTPAHLSGMNLESLMENQFLCDCMPSCVNGTCNGIVGECECNDGYQGEVCDTACDTGTYGEGCSQNCTCLPERESSPCDYVSGTCHCQPGYTGASCDEECPDGVYGQDCLDVCACENGDCNFITGFCNCSVGYTGAACNMRCPPLRYGLGCLESCTCQTGSCHHITGVCSCPTSYFGSNCDHDCTQATNCGAIGREECSEGTPEQTCGPCLEGYVGEANDGNTECIVCSGAPNCINLNRQPCSTIPNTCGPCNVRHITLIPGEEGFNNVPCFDPCTDGIMNYGETDVDCGGSLCPPCSADQMCAGERDCGLGSVCLGIYRHPSELDFPFDVQRNRSCALIEEPGYALAERFRNALRGRQNPLPDLRPLFTRAELEANVERELQIQFDISEPLDEIQITDFNQRPGDPLYQTCIEVQDDKSFDNMIQNIHNGRLVGTVVFNSKDNKALYNL